MAKVYYVGDWGVGLGPLFVETPFNYAWKGLDMYYYGRWLKEALESSGRHEVADVPTWEFYNLPPGAYEKILATYDVLIFSDVEAKNFQLHPQFFDRTKLGTRVLTFPDRIRLTIEAVTAGKRAMFLGGWLSFTGELGKGGWNRTRLKEILPVQCLDHDDLVESTEGFTAEPTPGRAFSGVDLASFPPILGYNKVLPRDRCDVLLRVKETGDPLVTVGTFGKGKTLAYMSDPAPHWGCNFVCWQHYGAFWLKCLDAIL